MDPITQQTVLASAGAAGADPVYVDDVFSTYLYRGNASSQSINNGIDLSGEGGVVWIKARSSSWDHNLFDTERGAGKILKANESDAEITGGALIQFNSNGFSIDGSGSNYHAGNNGNEKYASWSFRKAPGFFDVVTYTGNGTAGRTVSHNLGSVPGMIIVKATNDTQAWRVYHRSLGNTGALRLNHTNGSTSTYGQWNSTTPTASVFSLAGAGYNVNENNVNYVAYVFAHDDQSFGTDSDEAIVKCGSFTTDSNGHFDVDLGFEPQWVIYKRTDSNGGDWYMLDVMRGWTADKITWLQASNSSNELNYTYQFRPYERGFKTATNPIHGGNQTYIYMAIRRPHKPPTAGTEVFAMDTGSSSSTIPTWDSGFTVDMSFIVHPNSSSTYRLSSARLFGKKYLAPNNTDAEGSDGWQTWDSNVGWGKDYNYNAYSYMFRRAPGFFDVVAYSGTGSTQNINHNLESVPEIIICKARDVAFNWTIYNSSSGASKRLRFNNILASTSSTSWNNTAPTSSVFTVGSDANTNNSSTNYIAYLFATLDGISKVGSYTGTGSNINVDCGFAAGARFVLIKRTDSDGDWYVWDTFRGIASGNDPYFLLNTYAAQVTNTDYIDPLNAGFTVTSSAPADLNASGGTYLFLAIA